MMPFLAMYTERWSRIVFLFEVFLIQKVMRLLINFLQLALAGHLLTSALLSRSHQYSSSDSF